LKKIPLSIVYKDLSIKDSIIFLDDFGDSINDLSVRAHYSSPNLAREYGIDLFNNAVILPGNQFVSLYDGIELRVYSQRPASNLMICSDIHKSPSLRVQCINLAKKCDENNGNNEYSNHINGLGRGTVKVLFLGFVTMHFKEEMKMLESCSLSQYSPLYCLWRRAVIPRS